MLYMVASYALSCILLITFVMLSGNHAYALGATGPSQSRMDVWLLPAFPLFCPWPHSPTVVNVDLDKTAGRVARACGEKKYDGSALIAPQQSKNSCA
jgi:hypothetical protein